jgi:hypothetical protein
LVEIKLAWTYPLLAETIQLIVTLRNIELIEREVDDDGVSAGTAIRVQDL